MQKSLLKIGALIFIGLWNNQINAATKYELKKLFVVYKALDPLSISIEQPEKITVKSGTESFRYSEMNQSKSKIKVGVKAPYMRGADDILDTVYGTVTFNLVNGGNFSLNSPEGKSFQGRGFIVDGPSELDRKVLPLTRTSSSMEYTGNIEIDAIFNESNQNVTLGNYSGTLKLEVRYGG